jgi:hypothetical protein
VRTYIAHSAFDSRNRILPKKVHCGKLADSASGHAENQMIFRPENLTALKAGAAGNHAKGSMQASLAVG